MVVKLKCVYELDFELLPIYVLDGIAAAVVAVAATILFLHILYRFVSFYG